MPSTFPDPCPMCLGTGLTTFPAMVKLTRGHRPAGAPVKCLCVLVTEYQPKGKYDRGGPHEPVTDEERAKVTALLGQPLIDRIVADYLKIGSIRETARAHGLTFERVRVALRISGYVLGCGYRKWAGMVPAKHLRSR